MVKVDENFLNDWIYKIISHVSDEPDKARDELLKLCTYIIRAPQLEEGAKNYPKISIR